VASAAPTAKQPLSLSLSPEELAAQRAAEQRAAEQKVKDQRRAAERVAGELAEAERAAAEKAAANKAAAERAAVGKAAAAAPQRARSSTNPFDDASFDFGARDQVAQKKKTNFFQVEEEEDGGEGEGEGDEAGGGLSAAAGGRRQTVQSSRVRPPTVAASSSQARGASASTLPRSEETQPRMQVLATARASASTLPRSEETQAAARRVQAVLRGAKSRRKPELRTMMRVEVLLKGHKGLLRGLCCWRGQLDTSGAVFLGVALDRPLGHHDGYYAKGDLRCFKCEPRHGVFVPPSRARLEQPRRVQGARDPLDVDMGMSSDETDGDGASFGMSEAEGDDEINAPAGGALAAGAGVGGAGLKALGAPGMPARFVDPAVRLAIRLQAMVRAKKARDDTEYRQLADDFVMPPQVTLDEEGRHHAILIASDRSSDDV
jgi:hypothetical protein